MFRPLTRSHRRAPRRGTVVVITIFALITILMVLGLAFMMYAVKEKAVAQAYKEAASSPGTAAPDPTSTINKFLGTLLYDDYNDTDALHNALRGHSIARAMYGSRSDYSNTNPWIGSTVPWAGPGTFHEDPTGYLSGPGAGATPYPSLTGLNPARRDRARFVNHTVMTLDSKALVIDPEWTGNRFADNTIPLQPVLTAFNQSLANRSYVGLHAGYTYPDLKNFFLGARDPATGQVLVQSFYRDWLFRHEKQPNGQSALDPNNPNWGIPVTNLGGVPGITNPEGDARLRILRPLPVDHPKFPRVPPNPDGSFTGDVQNLTGALGVQKNDSLWMHIGLKPITLADGRIVQPMVAPLILPVDGLFDLAVHGNLLGAGNIHASYGGYGPWEVNMGYGLSTYNSSTATGQPPLTLLPALETDRKALLANRTGAAAAFDPYTGGRQLPSYSSVNWTGAPVNFTLPTGGSLRGLPSFGDPSFTPAYGDFQNNNTAINGHPAGYNPNEVVTISDTDLTKPIFPYSDIKRLSLRYAFTPDWYTQAFVTKNTGPAFRSDTTTFPYISSPGANTPSQYRLDPVHARRNLFSPRNNSLDRPAIAPSFQSRDNSNPLSRPLALGGGPGGPFKPGSLFATPTTYPSPQALGAITDFAAANQWVNAQAALGSVNLNRPLADYRLDTAQPLSLTNAANATLANTDRQQFAKDIFARLCVALGAAAQVSFDTTRGVVINLPQPGTLLMAGIPTPFTQAQYDVLRYLAQLAVNIVDYIDNDDVNTIFVWNPANAADPSLSLTTDLSATEVGNRAVFGIEKPRLVINEAYGEITNDPADPATDTMGLVPTKKAHVRFWAELLNPTSTPNGIFGTGSVALTAYQIQIARANRTFGPTGLLTASTLPMPQPGNTASYLTNNPAHPKYLENTMGVFDPAMGNPDVTFNLSTFATAPPIGPNNAVYAPAPADLPANGIALLRTDPGGTVKPIEFKADPAAPMSMWATSITAPAPDQPNSLGYVIQMPPSADDLAKPEFKQHVVLLQRLTNPYMAFNAVTNPYLTVDMMDYVPAFDAVTRAVGHMNSRVPRPATPQNDGTEYDPPAERFSVGKVQPLAGLSFATVMPGAGKYNQYTFATSMVLNQTAAPNATDPKNTFGRHNGHSVTQPDPTTSTVNKAVFPATIIAPETTLMTPFDWLPHMDRPLETLGDVFFARDSRPYRLTTEFVVNTNATPGLVYDSGYALWRLHEDGLARALEYLTVKSPSYHVAHGGRVSGKINVNAMQDLRVAQGLLDPQTSNKFFDLSFVNSKVWGAASDPANSWMKLRTPFQTLNNASGVPTFEVPVPSSSVSDQSGGPDRPFLPFGAPASAAGATFAYATGSGIDATVLRRDPAAPTLPLLYAPAATTTNAYAQSEPFRKMANNITTVSHSFVVYVTIGYFDVTYPATAPAGWPNNVNVPIPPQFGAEVYDKIPGDMRQKYIAFIDMANMALKPHPIPNDQFPNAEYSPNSPQPFFTSLTETVRQAAAPTTPVPISLASGTGDGTTMTILSRVPVTMQPGVDDQRVLISAGTQLAIGYGADIQYVTVDAVGPLAAGGSYPSGLAVNQLGVTGLNRPAWGGSCVSNVRPGYAGPQPGFDYKSINYKPVVPYVERLR